MFSLYYQATIIPNKIWLITSLLRNEDGWAFDRALEGNPSILEFFVSPSYEEEFSSFMNYCLEEGLITSFSKMDNRLE
jgi:hypothetical protein